MDQFLPPATKLGQGYVFTHVCDSVYRGGGLLPGGVPGPGGGVCSQGGEVETPPVTVTAAGGTHPTGMHSCTLFVWFREWQAIVRYAEIRTVAASVKEINDHGCSWNITNAMLWKECCSIIVFRIKNVCEIVTVSVHKTLLDASSLREPRSWRLLIREACW